MPSQGFGNSTKKGPIPHVPSLRPPQEVSWRLEAMVMVLRSAPRPWTPPPPISNLCPWEDLAPLHTGPASQQKGPLYVVARRREVRWAMITTSG